MNRIAPVVLFACISVLDLAVVRAEEPVPEPVSDAPAAAPVAPPEAPAEDRIVYRSVSLVRVNPLGLQTALELGYQHRLFESDSILTRDSFVGFAVAPMLTPAFAKFGIAAQAQPVAVLFLAARWNFVGWFGTANHVQTFESADADFSDTAIADGGERGQNGGATGWEVDLTAELRARVGPVVVRNRTMAIRSELAATSRPTDPFYYDPMYDLLMPTARCEVYRVYFLPRPTRHSGTLLREHRHDLRMTLYLDSVVSLYVNTLRRIQAHEQFITYKDRD